MKAKMQPAFPNPADRILTREAWKRLNSAILQSMDMGRVSLDIAIELSGFLSDLNIALHKKFGTLDQK